MIINKENVYVLLASHTVMTKKQIAIALGVKYNATNERQIRRVIAELAKEVPIIATSDTAGYSLATPYSLAEVRHQLAEFDSRIRQLEARKKPLQKLIEKFGAQ